MDKTLSALGLGDWIAGFELRRLIWLFLIFQLPLSEGSLINKNICSNSPWTWLSLECNVPPTITITWPCISHWNRTASGIRLGWNFRLYFNLKLRSDDATSVELLASITSVQFSLSNANFILESTKKCSGPILLTSSSLMRE